MLGFIRSSYGRGHTPGMIFSLLIGIVLGAGAIVFALQNTAVVTLTFLGYHFESSLALLVIASVGVGMLICALASIPSALSASFRIMGLKSENKKLVETVQAHKEALAAAAAPDSVVTIVDQRA